MILLHKISKYDLKYKNDIIDCLFHNTSNVFINKILIISDIEDLDSILRIDPKSKKLLLLKVDFNHFDMIKYAKKLADDYIIYSTPLIKFNSDVSNIKDRLKSFRDIIKCEYSYYIFSKSVIIKESNNINNILIGNKIDYKLSVNKLGYYKEFNINLKSIGWEICEISDSKIPIKKDIVLKEEKIVVNKDLIISKKEDISIRKSKLDLVIVSVNYNDFLIITLAKNRLLFDNITVVTSSDDLMCRKICEMYSIKCVVTEKMYEDGAVFNKGKAINEGIKSISDPDFILLIDADIIINNKIDLNLLEEDTFYSMDRIILPDYNSYLKYSEDLSLDNVRRDEENGFGYFQLFNYKHKQSYPEISTDAAWSDLIFRDKFIKRRKIEGFVTHLGLDGRNWKGRITDRFLTDVEFNNYMKKSTYKICSYYFNYRNDIRQKENFIKFLKQWEGYYENLIVGIVDYDDIDFEIPCETIIIKGDSDRKIWSKELLINKIIDKIDTDYLIWIDGDLIYDNLSWLNDIDKVVNGNDFVQLFENINYLGENGEVLESHKSIVSSGRNDIDNLLGEGYKPGGVWLGRTSILKEKKLFEKMYVGGGDTVFLYGLFGIDDGYTLKLVKENSEYIYKKAVEWIKFNKVYRLGYLDVSINHLYHGDLKDRNYNGRYKFLNEKYNYFSIVIPTMWKSDKIKKMLPIYENCEFIKEIIIIDNSPVDKIDISSYKKVIYYTNGNNIFVNPAWNKGFSLSSFELLLINDDLLIENEKFYQILNLISNSDLEIIGVDINKFGNPYIEELDCDFPGNSFGCLMYIKDYKYIPEQLKIWYGDDIQYNFSKSKGIIRNANIVTKKSETVNSNILEFREKVGKNDIKEFKIISSKPKDEDTLNVIIRTSKRPKYFKACIESIRKYVKSYKLHISIDNINDITYVKSILKDEDFSYYIIDKDKINNICDKIKITRNRFIYNYYYNIISDYLSGWCMYLDDDDQIISNPEFTNDISKIFIHKVDIGKKIVPSKLEGRPLLNDISGISTIFHSSKIVKWIPQRGGDFDFISNLYDISDTVYIDKVIAKGTSLDFYQDLGGNFGNGNDIYLDKKVSVNMATYPARIKSLIKVIENLLENNIIDIIRVYMNEYKELPEELPKSERIIYHIGGENIMDSGKFFWASDKKDEYYFTIDDDLIYPQIYFIRHLGLLKKYNNDIFITLHGKIMNEYPKVFNDCIKSYHCLKDVYDDVFINNPGTGVFLFDNSKYNIPMNIFERHGMADLCISAYCQKNNIPILCRKHEKDEIKHIFNKNTLFERRFDLNNEHQFILKEIGKWKIFKR